MYEKLDVNEITTNKNVKSISTVNNLTAQDHVINKCMICGKSFSKISHLKRHIHIIHYGCRDYKCESCGKSFTGASYLKKHIYIIHEGHKDYKCESCGKSFTTSGYLKKHIHTIHIKGLAKNLDNADSSTTM